MSGRTARSCSTGVRLELGTLDGAFKGSPDRVRARPQRARGRLVHEDLAQLGIAVRDPPLTIGMPRTPKYSRDTRRITSDKEGGSTDRPRLA